MLQQYRFNISLPHRLQSQQSILEKLGKMVALLNWFQYKRLFIAISFVSRVVSFAYMMNLNKLLANEISLM